ncbi:MAG: CAP domain-containing protein [Gemmobacter sp.]
MRRSSVAALLVGVLALAACEQHMPVQYGPDGRPLPQLYSINSSQTGRIQLRMLDSVNTLRQASGAAPLQLNAQLNAAAATHARDMSVQNRPWHFGSDGSSPLDRVQRAGYPGTMLGELISETYETELETLGAWMEDPNTRAVLLAPEARDMGFNFHQDPNGKIWWTLVTGGGSRLVAGL